MDDLKLSTAIRTIAQKTHKDDGITQAQLRAIAADASVAPEVRVVAQQLAKDDIYEAFRKIEKEGRFNDDNVTARDLFAAARGTSYDGKRTVDSPSLFASMRNGLTLDATLKAQRDAVATALNIAMVLDVAELRQYRNDVTGFLSHTYIDRQGMEHTVKASVFKEKLDAFDALKIGLTIKEENGVRKFVRAAPTPGGTDEAKPSPLVTDPKPPPNAPRR